MWETSISACVKSVVIIVLLNIFTILICFQDHFLWLAQRCSFNMLRASCAYLTDHPHHGVTFNNVRELVLRMIAANSLPIDYLVHREMQYGNVAQKVSYPLLY